MSALSPQNFPSPRGSVICNSAVAAPMSDVKPKRVRLFIKPYCGWCHKAMRWLNDRGVDYTTIDVTADESAMAEMVRLSGAELAPVIEVEGQVLADFGPEQLAEFWERLEKANGRT
jgi:glutaredoxin 3